jgi:uncharacterized protein YwgA
MTSPAAQRYALIAQLVSDYNETFGRPAGKKAVQKLFYVLQRRAKEAKLYGFSFYNYGVYSHDLARDISEAERYDFLDVEYDGTANAYSIKPSSHFEENRRFVPTYYRIDSLKDVLSLSAKDLELITTIMFVCDEEKISERQQIISRVLELKPKFSEGEVSAKIRPEYCGCA